MKQILFYCWELRTISFLAKVYGFLNLLDLSLMEKARELTSMSRHFFSLNLLLNVTSECCEGRFFMPTTSIYPLLMYMASAIEFNLNKGDKMISRISCFIVFLVTPMYIGYGSFLVTFFLFINDFKLFNTTIQIFFLFTSWRLASTNVNLQLG